MTQSSIELKGSSFTLPVLHIYHDDIQAIIQAIKQKIQHAPTLLKDAAVVVDIHQLSTNADILAIKHAIEFSGLQVVGFSGWADDLQRQNLINLGLSTLNKGKISKTFTSSTEATTLIKSRIINTPIRSGQQIYARDTDLVVTNVVSAGAELVADGNIHIYGVMRGRALAGAKGDKNSEIFCFDLQAELISIAGEYWISEQIPKNFHGQPSRLRLQNGALTIESLS